MKAETSSIDEEHPLGGPAEDERADEHFRGQRRGQPDGPPDAHAGDRAEHDGQQDEEPGVAAQVAQVFAVARAVGVSDLDGQEQPAADGVMRHENVHDRNDGDQHRRRQIRDVPPGIVHGRWTPVVVFSIRRTGFRIRPCPRASGTDSEIGPSAVSRLMIGIDRSACFWGDYGKQGGLPCRRSIASDCQNKNGSRYRRLLRNSRAAESRRGWSGLERQPDR